MNILAHKKFNEVFNLQLAVGINTDLNTYTTIQQNNKQTEEEGTKTPLKALHKIYN